MLLREHVEGNSSNIFKAGYRIQALLSVYLLWRGISSQLAAAVEQMYLEGRVLILSPIAEPCVW
jgi:hypothetical protein